MEKRKDYYQLLGVPRDASVSAIRQAFKRIARGFSPGRTAEAPDAFAEIQAAYEPSGNSCGSPAKWRKGISPRWSP